MNEYLKLQCDNFINNFNRFDKSIRNYNEGLNKNMFDNLEFKLPSDFKYILSIYNGLSLLGTEVYGIDLNSKNSLIQVLERERNEVEYPIPEFLIPFSPDGRGNYYCLNLNNFSENGDTCKIIFWQYGQSIDDMEIVNNSFIEWAEEVLIGWALEDYNYDGSEK